MTFDIEKGRLREYSERGRDAIEKAGATLIIHPHIHSKTICVDQKILMEGSFIVKKKWFANLSNGN